MQAHPFPPFTLRPSPRKGPSALPRARAQGPTPFPAQGAASSTADAAHWGCPTLMPSQGWVNCTQELPCVPGANAPGRVLLPTQRNRAGVLKLLPHWRPAEDRPAWATVSGHSQSSDPFPTSNTQTRLGVGGCQEGKPTQPRGRAHCPTVSPRAPPFTGQPAPASGAQLLQEGSGSEDPVPLSRGFRDSRP